MFNWTKNIGAKAALLGGIVATIGFHSPAIAGEDASLRQALNGGPALVRAEDLRINPAGGPTCGVQFTGTIPGNSTQLYFTFNWNAANYIDWTVMSKTVYTGGSEISLTNVATQRADATHATYWLTVVNNSPNTQNFQGRFCILH